MQKAIINVIVLGIIAGGVYVALKNEVLPNPTSKGFEEALMQATLDMSEFGGDKVALEDGEASFVVGDQKTPTGYVSLQGPRGEIQRGDNVEIFTLMSVSGGGTGVFQFLAHLSYEKESERIIERQRILLGDRVTITAINVEQTAPTSYEVLVSMKDRGVFEAMSSVPTHERVLHFKQGEEGTFELAHVIHGTLQKHDVVVVWPLPNAQVGKSFVVQGAARGPWYFEASFGVTVLDAQGTQIAQGIAQADGEWMTEELVPFTAPITLPADAQGVYALVLQKDNPSGLPEHDASVELPIFVQ